MGRKKEGYREVLIYVPEEEAEQWREEAEREGLSLGALVYRKAGGKEEAKKELPRPRIVLHEKPVRTEPTSYDVRTSFVRTEAKAVRTSPKESIVGWLEEDEPVRTEEEELKAELRELGKELEGEEYPDEKKIKRVQSLISELKRLGAWNGRDWVKYGWQRA